MSKFNLGNQVYNSTGTSQDLNFSWNTRNRIGKVTEIVYANGSDHEVSVYGVEFDYDGYKITHMFHEDELAFGPIPDREVLTWADLDLMLTLIAFCGGKVNGIATDDEMENLRSKMSKMYDVYVGWPL